MEVAHTPHTPKDIQLVKWGEQRGTWQMTLASLGKLLLNLFICCHDQIVPTYERMVVFRLGRIRTPQGPGMVLLLPFIDSFQRVDLRTRAFNVPPCKVRGISAALHRRNGACIW